MTTATTEAAERHPLTTRIEGLLRGRSYGDYPADEDLFDELLDEIDAAVIETVPAAAEPTSEPAVAVTEGRPALDPDPISGDIDAVLAEVQAERIDRGAAYEQIEAILTSYADAIETAGGGESGDPDMWEWSQRVRFASIPDGYEPMDLDEYLGEFSDALTCLWGDPRPTED